MLCAHLDVAHYMVVLWGRLHLSAYFNALVVDLIIILSWDPQEFALSLPMWYVAIQVDCSGLRVRAGRKGSNRLGGFRSMTPRTEGRQATANASTRAGKQTVGARS